MSHPLHSYSGKTRGAGEGGRPQAQPKEGAQKTEIWGKKVKTPLLLYYIS